MTLDTIIKFIINYIGNVWSALSQTVNTLLLFGEPNESISGRCYREQWFLERVVNSLFFWQERHCRGAYNNDVRWAVEHASNPERVEDEQPSKLWGE